MMILAEVLRPNAIVSLQELLFLQLLVAAGGFNLDVGCAPLPLATEQDLLLFQVLLLRLLLLFLVQDVEDLLGGHAHRP